MDVPPSRYKVVEQGRRLVVIDTLNGNAPVTRPAPAANQAARPATVEQARAAVRPKPRRAAGGTDTAPVITTRAWFDNKAPRRVRIGPETQSKLMIVLVFALPITLAIFFFWGWPVFLVLAFILAQAKVRKGLRSAVTPMLDGLETG